MKPIDLIAWYEALDINFKFKHHFIISGCHLYCRGSLLFMLSICWSQKTRRKVPSGKALCTSFVLSFMRVDKSWWSSASTASSLCHSFDIFSFSHVIPLSVSHVIPLSAHLSGFPPSLVFLGCSSIEYSCDCSNYSTRPHPVGTI